MRPALTSTRHANAPCAHLAGEYRPTASSETYALLDPINIHLPNLPPALDGFRIAHVTDLHADVPRRYYRGIIDAVAAAHVDLIALTGDYMTRRGREAHPLKILRALCQKVAPPHGIYGVFGNHDSIALGGKLEPFPVQWLGNGAVAPKALPLEILGLDFLNFGRCDASATLTARPHGADADSHERAAIMLCHYPTCLPIAADLGVDLMLSGHTHGGQCRLPGPQALINSTDWPLRLTSGVLRHRDTLCVISRGIGEVHLPLRVFCPRQIPVLTLRRGPLPGIRTDTIVNLRPW